MEQQDSNNSINSDLADEYNLEAALLLSESSPSAQTRDELAKIHFKM